MSEYSRTEGDGLDAAMAAAFGGTRVSVLNAIERATHTQLPRVSLREGEPGNEGPLTRPFSRSSGSGAPTVAGRANYVLHGELARGGMGVLLKGQDLDLGREVALKVLREDLASRPEIVQRFVEEAQIGGQLQHPGIVPVYELGLMDDKRPYFAMKLVKGRTLAALLSDRGAADRRKLLDVFASICQTMAYAHSRGVVHRDLKPANVLIGAFGEVQVIDWGLAKVLTTGGAADERRSTPLRPSEIVATVRSGSSVGSQSLAGAVMGTPAYMAPEQARGEAEKIDERTDVFALGATLCEILTGSPPYLGENEQTIVQAANTELDDARRRLAECDADPELVELCRACLAPQRTERPRSAASVAERMAAYLASLAERARSAELRAAEARVRARSTAVFSAGAVAAAMIAAVLWINWREGRDRARQGLERSVAADIGAARAASGENDWVAAKTALERARTRLDGAEDVDALRSEALALAEQVDASAREQEQREQLERSNRELLAAFEEVRQPEGDKVYPTDWALLDRAYAEAFARHGLDLASGDSQALAKALESRGMPLELASALDEWSSVRRNARQPDDAAQLTALAIELDPDSLRVRLREALRSSDVGVLREIASDAAARLASAPTLWLLGHALAQAGELELAIPLLEVARRKHPADFKLAIELARALRIAKPPRAEAALAHYEAALALRPDRVVVWHDLGQTLVSVGRNEEALAVFERAVELAPQDTHLLHHVGNTLSRLHRYAESVEVFERVLQLAPGDGSTLVDLALALGALGRADDAREHLERAVEIAPDLFDGHLHLGVERAKSGRFDEAVLCLERALELTPASGNALFWRAYCLTRVGRLEEAIADYRRSLELAPEPLDTHLYLALALQSANEPVESRDLLEAALLRAPDDPRFLGALASLLAVQADEQVGGPLRALAPARRLTQVLPSFAFGYVLLATALISADDLEGAREALQSAAQLGESSTLRFLLDGVCALRSGDRVAARASFEVVRQHVDSLRQEHPPLRSWIEEAEQVLREP